MSRVEINYVDILLWDGDLNLTAYFQYQDILNDFLTEKIYPWLKENVAEYYLPLSLDGFLLEEHDAILMKLALDGTRP